MKVPYSPVWFHYLARNISAHIKSKKCKTTSTHYRILLGMTRSKYSVKHATKRLKFTTEQQLEALRNVIGSTVLYGFREPRPVLGQQIPLRNLHSMNVVVGAPSNASITTTTEQVDPRTRQKWDFVKIKFSGRELFITVSYHRYLYRNDGTNCLQK